ncbi:MbtH family protein [Agrobacterium rhizogenes]|uniref:MbtH family protein n=1 Tax=Rhizobium rhizogenes TaxID=359 RepID=UPI0004D8B845|nr:MbtH family protein [Rhizobium rhizogenes]KEA07748.1 antibiotic synthesis protein MbtH [Rhizobium rhizogenes]MDJ1637605.1 MbtH family protein [Rhizobium rhizogenes]MQB34152.1 MbtH family protein [Rhizobium rhizogenes]NTF72511.1 MbtH family protein [Rhizobium rhizogenes]NTG90662.1 MbtH family protein [Rhizobium rhizogenes]
MTVNPFDDPNGVFYALINGEEQYSLWPAFKDVPEGWNIVHGAPDGAPRQEVLDWIDKTWTDMTPRSLRSRPSPQTSSSGTL